MKKNLKKLSVLFIALIIAALSVSVVFSETIYEYYGLKYTIINNYSVSICGRTNTSDDDISIPDVIFDREVADIASRAFIEDSDLKSVDFRYAKNLESIGNYAFKSCSNLSGELYLPENITFINTAAFQECSSLESVIINSKISDIPSQMFYKCSSLSNVTLNDGIKTIGSYAFADCPDLKYVELSKNIESIAKTAFSNDPDLVLGVYKDSAAHNYAKNYNKPYILLDGPKTGDVNGDGAVDIFDATDIQKFAAEKIIFTDEQFELADINKDGYVDVMDALLVQKHVIGKYDIPEIIYNS